MNVYFLIFLMLCLVLMNNYLPGLRDAPGCPGCGTQKPNKHHPDCHMKERDG